MTQETARQRGLSLARELCDNDVSATSGKTRDGFVELLAGIEDRTVGTVVAVSMERLLRTNRDKYVLLEACQAHEVNIVLARGTDIDMRTAVGRMVADQLATAARFEVELKSERQRAQRQQEAEQGRAPAARRAFGYTAREVVAGQRWPQVHLDTEEAPLVAEAYRQVINGRSMAAVAAWLREQGSTTPGGRKWTYHNLRTVLVNPRYKGVRGVRMLLPGRDGMAGKREPFHTEVADGQWPGIVDADTWDAAQMILRDSARRVNHPVNEHGARYLLPFLARCGVCDARLITGSRAYTLRETGERVHDRLLRCPTRRHVCRKARPVEEWVEVVLMKLLAQPEVQEELRRSAASPDVDVSALQARKAAAATRKVDATAMWTAGEQDTTFLRQVHRQADAIIAEIDAELLSALTVDPTLEIGNTANPRAVWEKWPIDTRRALVAAWLDVVVYSGKPGRPGGKRFDSSSVKVTWR